MISPGQAHMTTVIRILQSSLSVYSRCIRIESARVGVSGREFGGSLLGFRVQISQTRGVKSGDTRIKSRSVLGLEFGMLGMEFECGAQNIIVPHSEVVT